MPLPASQSQMLNKRRYYRAHAAHSLHSFQAVFADFHRLDMRRDHEYPKHCHGGYEAILVERGPYLCELNGEEVRLLAGEVLVIKPGDTHADHLRKGQRHFVLHFTLNSAQRGRAPELFAPGVRAVQQIVRGNFSRDAGLLKEIQSEAQSGFAYAAAVQDGLLAALFWRWVRGLPAAALSREWRELPAAEGRREEIARVLASHVARNPALPELACELNVSLRQLTTQCRRLLGAPPAKLLQEFKLREAERMLRHQGKRVSEVSEALGFANPFHFSRVCRRAWGFPPSTLAKG